MSKAPEIRVRVADMDRLLLLTGSQLKVWLYYKRREGVDGKAWSKTSSIAAACGFTKPTSPQSIKNTRAWLVKNGWLRANGRSKSGLPMFLAVIPRLPLEVSEGNPQITPPVIVGLPLPSSPDYTEVPTLEVATLKGSALTSGKEQNKEPLAALAEAGLLQAEENQPLQTLEAVSEDKSKATPTPEDEETIWLHPSVWSLQRIWKERTGLLFTDAERILADKLITTHRYRVVEAVLRNTLYVRPKSAKLRWNKFAIFAEHWQRNHEEYLAYCASAHFKKNGHYEKPVQKFGPVPEDNKIDPKEWNALTTWFKESGKIGEWQFPRAEWELMGMRKGHVYTAMLLCVEEGIPVTKGQFLGLLEEVLGLKAIGAVVGGGFEPEEAE